MILKSDYNLKRGTKLIDENREIQIIIDIPKDGLVFLKSKDHIITRRCIYTIDKGISEGDITIYKSKNSFKINWKEVSKSPGYQSLKKTVLRNTGLGRGVRGGQNCFNPNGCDHEFYRQVPQENLSLLEREHKTACRQVSKCDHKYCNIYKWVIDKAKKFAIKYNLSMGTILTIWEKDRNGCSFLNNYQKCYLKRMENMIIQSLITPRVIKQKLEPERANIVVSSKVLLA